MAQNQEKSWRELLVPQIPPVVATLITGAFIVAILGTRQMELQADIAEKDRSTRLLIAQTEQANQQNLVDLKAQLDRQATIARLQVREACPYFIGCGTAVDVENTSQSIARNVRVIVSTNGVSDNWLEFIKDIGQFTVKVFPTTSNVSVNRKKVDALYDYQDVEENNSFEIVKDVLSPGESIRVSLSIDYNSSNYQRLEFNGPFVVENISSQDAIEEFSTRLRALLESALYISSFSAVAACDNCEGPNTSVSIQISSLGSLAHDSVKIEPSISSCLTSSCISPARGALWRANISGDYFIPRGSRRFPPLGYPIHTSMTYLGQGKRGFSLASILP